MRKIVGLLSALCLFDGASALAQDSTFYFRLNFERPAGVTAKGISEGHLTVPDLYVGETVGIQGTYAGGDGNVSWRNSGSPLPSGLSLSGTGFLGGVPLAAGTYGGISFELTDTLNSTFTVKPGTIRVYDQLSIAPVVSRIVVGKNASIDLNINGGKSPYTASISGGMLPNGMTLSGTKIRGTATSKGNINSEIRVVDSNGKDKTTDVLIEVYDALFATSAITDGYIGVPYSGTVTASGGENPYVWYLSSGTQPKGLTFQSDGRLVGTPEITGKFDMVARVADGTSQFFSLPISLGVYELPTINTAFVPDIYVGESFLFDMSGTGGKSPVAWSGSNLPSGLAINSTGRISGVATAKEAVSTTIRLTDSNGRIASKSFTLSTYNQLAMSAKTFADAYVGVAYDAADGQPPALSGGKSPIAWSATGLPAGMTINGSNGQISGVPTVVADSTVTISATDANSKTVSKKYGLSTRGALALQAKAYSDPYVGVAYTTSEGAAPAVSGGKAPYAWSATKLPQGMTINSATGVISGVPTSDAAVASTITVTDANSKSVSRAYDFAVRPNFVISSVTLNPAVAGITNVNHQFIVSGGKPGYTWSSTGKMPAGVTLSSAGLLSGVPTVANNYVFSVVATDANARSTSLELTYTVTAPSICALPWGGSLAHGASVSAYQVASVAWDGTCSPETRTCSNGTLSGSFTNSSCVKATPTNCTAPWGGTVNHGASITAYQSASVPSTGTCTPQTRTCTNGTLSGSYANSSCVKNCSTPWGATVNHGASTTAYQTATVAWNGTCTAETRTCSNGALSGTFANGSCAKATPANCTTPWGVAVNHGSSVTAFQTATVAWDGTCTSQSRTCTDGVLSGTYSNSACAKATPLNCTAPWGGTVNHGSSITAFQTASVPSDGTCTSQSRTCTNGVLSGSYTNGSCVQNCSTPWGAAVNHGAAVTAYQAATVAWNATCTSQSRACSNGTLSGTYANKACTVTAPLNCTDPWGVALAHGSSVTAYQAATVPYGSTCASQARTCTNGVVSGSYASKTCVVTAPKDCGSVKHGASATFYSRLQSSVPCSNVSQRRTCTNGVLSGSASYSYTTCFENSR